MNDSETLYPFPSDPEPYEENFVPSLDTTWDGRKRHVEHFIAANGRLPMPSPDADPVEFDLGEWFQQQLIRDDLLDDEAHQVALWKTEFDLS